MECWCHWVPYLPLMQNHQPPCRDALLFTGIYDLIPKCFYTSKIYHVSIFFHSAFSAYVVPETMYGEYISWRSETVGSSERESCSFMCILFLSSSLCSVSLHHTVPLVYLHKRLGAEISRIVWLMNALGSGF